jgi:hypothetical protein
MSSYIQQPLEFVVKVLVKVDDVIQTEWCQVLGWGLRM